MDAKIINQKLLLGELDLPSMFPHIAGLDRQPFVFNIDFGLSELPKQPGILMIRGARQYGKSTWLEQQLYQTITEFGPGTAFYLNGESLLTTDNLVHAIENLLPAFTKNAVVKRIFIDEITAIDGWEIGLKRLADQGELIDVLVVTTGSKATDLRRGFEKLPGRKGKLDRTSYLFTPISYSEFSRVCGDTLKADTLNAYILSGGSPIACSELASTGRIPEYVIELVRDWIDGEVSRSGRSRVALSNVMKVIYRFGATPIGQSKLARESGLANNTVAAGFIELLNDLGCVIPSFPWDQHRNILILRKPCKYHFTNLLAAIAYHPARIRSVEDFKLLSSGEQGLFHEWLISQELLRRSAIRGDEILQPQAFWQNKSHEVDFVASENNLIEVKLGGCSAMEFSWFVKQFPGKHLTVVNARGFESERIMGQPMEAFLTGPGLDS